MIYISILFGLIIGSFLNVCIYRIPKGESIAFPPSHCPACNHRLQWVELIPVLSWLALRGQCKKCGTRISIQYPLVELLTGGFFALAYLNSISLIQTIYYCLFISILVIISFIDIKHRIIPDVLVIIAAVLGVLGIIFKLGPTLTDGLLGIAVGGGTLLLIAYLSVWLLKKEGMGGGDIKLMAMVGLFLGWKLTALALMLGVYAGAIYALILMLIKRKKIGDAFAFGPFLVIGTIVSLFWGQAIIQWYLMLL